MYDDILVPTDGSADMSAVAEHAVGIAERCNATVHTLYVVDDAAYATVPEDVRDRVREALDDDGEDATRAIAERAVEAGLDTRRELRRGDPAAAIVGYAVENEVDLIVMGTRGKTGFERFLLGSVAEKVVRVSPIPVLSVHVGDLEELTAEIEDALDRD